MTTPTPDLAERVLIFALFGGDGVLTQRFLRASDVDSCICHDLESLLSAIDEGAGAVVISEEALHPDAARRLLEVVARQPAWSDLPIVISAKRRDTLHEAGGVLGPLGERANVTVLDRPVHVRTLVSTVKSALRARNRQYQAREILEGAEAMSRAKDEFLATVSHELRTPLNAMLGWSRMLNAGRLDGNKQKRALEAIERNAIAQAQLIEDLLDVSRIITGKLRLQLEKVELRAVLEAALDSVRPTAEDKGILLSRLTGPESLHVLGDPHRLQQIVWNLLSNAVKFTPQGGTIGVALEQRDSRLQFRVSDNGQGIDPAFLPHVFQRFRQADNTTTRKHGGLGLGLSICRHLVELHGGTIEATSDGIGRGSTLTVSLPTMAAATVADTDRAADSMPNADLTSPPELRGLKVLVIDDEPDARDLLSTLLEHCHAVPLEASSAVEALVAMRQHPDVIVSDIGMPLVDGYELIRRIRALSPEEGGRTPAAAITAFAHADDRRHALRAGFEMFVPKPVEPAEFLAVVATLARIRTAMR